ncbi:MAG: hypothetical protein CVU38_01615 [Chloroflexi bacterium HGW-Chloroflexi-1]|nr:MAG: hypothetical protein CVU38_01615 [Chloroflexi bacterium HGW-Chloroflexi-1]
MLRQGDPARVGVIPAIDDYPRASHLAADIGPADAGWAPFADLLSHFFVETVQRALRAPTPLLWHLPAGAASIVLFSGDEDSSTVAWNEDEMDYVAAAGARMNLYVIPTSTRSTRADVQRYTARHDVGPHPDLEAMRNRPAPELLKELERQIRIFQETFQAPARSLRTHCLIWAGYMEHVEALERLGVRMDSSYFCARLMRGREFAPYEAFGAAMPMRFCRPDGRLFQVFQQHLHLSDDLMFGNADYSYKLSPQQFKVILRRILSDSATRFHTPYAVIIHPENWALFSRPQGQEILRQAAQSGIPVWSFDQWLTFWEARDTWLFDDVSWDGASLQFTLAGSAPHDGLCFAIPTGHAGMSLDQVKVNGEATDWRQVVRYGKAVALVSLPPGKQTVSVRSTYGQYLRNACGSASGAV